MTEKDVLSVYVGRIGKCCCGCSGKHTYNPDHREEGSANRGYTVGPEECDIIDIRHVLGLVQEAAAVAEFGVNNISIETATRVFVVYPLSNARIAQTKATAEGAVLRSDTGSPYTFGRR